MLLHLLRVLGSLRDSMETLSFSQNPCHVNANAVPFLPACLLALLFFYLRTQTLTARTHI